MFIISCKLNYVFEIKPLFTGRVHVLGSHKLSSDKIYRDFCCSPTGIARISNSQND